MTENNERIVFLKGKLVALRPLNAETDSEKCFRWANDREVIENTTIYLPSSLEQAKEWLKSLAKDEKNIVLAVEAPDGVHIGNVALHCLNWKNRTAKTGMIIGEKEYWGKRYGTDAKMTLLLYAFNVLNLRKIRSAVGASNTASIKSLTKCGYRQYATRSREIFRNGTYHDELLFEVFKEDWLVLGSSYFGKEV